MTPFPNNRFAKPQASTTVQLEQRLYDSIPDPQPTEELSEEEQKVWDKIKSAKAKDEWVGIDEFAATNLCKLLVEVRGLERQCAEEGYTTRNRMGELRVHPLYNIVVSMWHRIFKIQTRLVIAPSEADLFGSVKSGRNGEKLVNGMTRTIDGDFDDLLPRIGLAPVPVTGGVGLKDNFKPEEVN